MGFCLHGIEGVLDSTSSAATGVEVLSTPANTDRTWRFGVFEVDTRREELRRSGALAKLRDQSFRILVYLLEHSGEIVTREELRQVLWPSDTFVDFDHSLNTAMMKLRDALGDVADAPVYIETIPRRGYRFIAPVTKSTEPITQTSQASPAVSPWPVNDAAPATVQSSTPAGRSFFQHRAALLLLLLLVITTTLVGYVFMFRSSARRTNSDRKLLGTIPITSAAGDAISPSSPPMAGRSPTSGTAPIAKATTSTCNWSALTSRFVSPTIRSALSAPRHGLLTAARSPLSVVTANTTAFMRFLLWVETSASLRRLPATTRFRIRSRGWPMGTTF